MKAIRIHQFGGPEVMQLQEIDNPQPAQDEVLVQIKAVGINPVETYIRAGTYGPRDFPFTPGMDASGVIESVGRGVQGLRPGDRVYTDNAVSGTYAEMALCKITQVHALPDDVTFAQGAAIGVPYVTAYRALFQRGAALPGERVLVHGGTGGVGLAAVQFAAAAGMTVIATGGSVSGRKLLTSEGAHHVLDHHQADYLDQIAEITGGKGVDIILEMLANVNLAKDLSILAKQGRVMVVGSRGKVEIDPRNTMMHDADIRGISGPNISQEDRASIHAAIGAGLKNKTLRPIVAREFALADASQAHIAVIDSSVGSHGKIVLTT